jgi:phage/plasmid primase-like uncharacterized protein
MNKTWKRVSRAHPCPVCGKPDWCLSSADGRAAICARVESSKRCGDAGWLHWLADDPAGPRRHVRTVCLTAAQADFGSLAAEYRDALDAGRRHQLARQLGVSEASLAELGVGSCALYDAYSFPMADAGGGTVGIQLRRPDGTKFAVRGSRQGLFLPTGAVSAGIRLLICEGATDAAALWDLGYGHVAGRPSCTGGVKLVCELVRRRRPGDVVIIADADEPGRRGADNLASTLVCYAPAVRVIVPPGGAKDVRDFLRAGGTRGDLEAVIDAAPVLRVRVRSGRIGP